MYRSVSHIVLGSAAFLLFGDVLQSGYTEHLRVDMEGWRHWAELKRLLTSGKVGKPRSLSLVCPEDFFEDGWQDDTGDLYPAIRDKVTSRGIPLSLYLLRTPTYSFVPLLQCLAEVSAELVEARFSIPEEAYEDLPPSDSLPEINFDRLRELELDFSEGIRIIPESCSTCCDPLLSRFSAPELASLRFYIETPHTLFLQSLIRALWRGAFPKLRRIEGRLDASDGITGWRDAIRAHYRDLLEDVCAKRDIDLRNLQWLA
jgi:hypothetical protein